MIPESSNIRSDGTNTGAAMIVHRRPPCTDECCHINIYVNNNVQGVTNSLVFGSKVVMRDPGVRVLLRQGSRLREELPVAGIRKAAKASSPGEFGIWVMLALLFVFVFSIVFKL